MKNIEGKIKYCVHSAVERMDVLCSASNITDEQRQKAIDCRAILERAAADIHRQLYPGDGAPAPAAGGEASC